MKRIRVILLALLFIGCKKEIEKTCYYCEFGFSAEPPRTVCLWPWEKIEDIDFVDANNNDLSPFCIKQ